LHLLGFDHAEPDDEKQMFGLQRDLLTAWQVGRTAQATSSAPTAESTGT
jgi:probable rRNA maturation factor